MRQLRRGIRRAAGGGEQGVEGASGGKETLGRRALYERIMVMRPPTVTESRRTSGTSTALTSPSSRAPSLGSNGSWTPGGVSPDYGDAVRLQFDSSETPYETSLEEQFIGRFLKKPLSYVQPIELSYVVTRVVELRSTRATSADRRAVPRSFFCEADSCTAQLNASARTRTRVSGSLGTHISCAADAGYLAAKRVITSGTLSSERRISR